MGTVAIQTQCCLSKADDDEEEESSTEEGTAVQLVAPLPWHGRAGPVGLPATNLARSSSEATTILAPQTPRH